MKYVIYSAVTQKGAALNLTHNPYLDYSFFRNEGGIRSFEVLTPSLPISYAHYIKDAMDKENNPFIKIMLKDGKIGSKLKFEMLKRLMNEFGVKPLKKTKLINSDKALADKNDIEAVYHILNGKLTDFHRLNEIIGSSNIFMKEGLYDILQILYLEGRLDIFPLVHIDKVDKKYFCKSCESEIPKPDMEAESKCPGCGAFLELDKPLFAVSYKSEKLSGYSHVKYKHQKNLTVQQENASLSLSHFLRDSGRECLLWTVPGTEDISIAAKAVRDVIGKGGRAAVAVSCYDKAMETTKVFREAFSSERCIYNNKKSAIEDGSITICGFQDIKTYYKTFDLIILNETPGCCMSLTYNHIAHAKRAADDRGKIVFMTSTPDYGLYENVQKGELKLIAVPLRSHGKPIPEPRVMTYRILHDNSYYVPDDVLNFIKWSINEGVRVHIIVPTYKYIRPLYNELQNIPEVKKSWLAGTETMIYISTSANKRVLSGEVENILVFFADDNMVFDEKALIDAAGLSGRSVEHGGGEVVFVGSKESEEMYHTKLMLRFINKLAWEMGYLK
jgi:competence protein ComFA